MSITTMLQGGLGNQMFQYAMGLAQAKRLGTDLILDTTSLRYDSMRQYNLGLFNVQAPTTVNSIATVHENGLPYNPDLAYSIKDQDVIRGYWQTEKYFSEVKQTVKQRFAFCGQFPQIYYPTVKNWILNAGKRSTFLTIRRTDYVQKQDFHGVLPMEYYDSALEMVAGEVGTPEIFVFSDEPDWCKQNLNFKYHWRVVGTYDRTTSTHMGREDLDLYLMSLCHNAVMANSSFSWWGAWLGEKPGGMIVGPKQWFTTPNEDSRDIIPDRWVKL